VDFYTDFGWGGWVERRCHTPVVDSGAMDADHALFALASRQHSIVTRGQLEAAGVGRRAIDERVRRGRLERVHRGVYRLPGSVTTFEQATLAACFALGGTSAASHRAAARLWGVDLGPGEDVIELSTSRPRSDRLPHVLVHRSVDLTDAQIVTRRGIPTTNPLRLLVDLGAVVSSTRVGLALDDLIGRRIVSASGVHAALEHLAARGRSGCGVLREILDHRSQAELRFGRTRLEALLSELCREAGIDDLEFQHPIVLGGRKRRIDFALVHLRIAIEVDGYETHSRFDVFQDDRVRANELEVAGWTVLRFTWQQVTEQPGYVVSVIARAIRAAA
jgi:very-short-patch-repair endonuclease